ncbi:MAG: hypothetical protein R6W97_06150 [Thiobacillus sp.]
MGNRLAVKGMHRFISGLFLAILLSACGSIYRVPLGSPIKQRPAVEPSPRSVDILYTENLRNHHCIVEKGYISEKWAIELGPPSIDMYDLIFSTLFEQSRTLDSGHNFRPNPGSGGLIEVHLLNFDGCEARWPIVGANIEVAYQATLFAMNGATVASWEGRGRAGPSDNLAGYKESVPLLQVETRYLGP